MLIYSQPDHFSAPNRIPRAKDIAPEPVLIIFHAPRRIHAPRNIMPGEGGVAVCYSLWLWGNETLLHPLGCARCRLGGRRASGHWLR